MTTIALCFGLSCAHPAPVSDALPIAAVKTRPVLKTSAKKWKLEPAPSVSLDTAEERFVFAIIDTYPTSLSKDHERRAAETVVAQAKAYDLDPFLVLALMRVESSGRNYARSSVDARGLMQILPWVGRELATGTEVLWQGPDTLYDPAINIELGVKYLAQLRDRFGSLELALAAYNVGPTRLQKRIDRGQKTIDYASKILWFADRYRALAAPGNDLSPRTATITLGLAKLEREIGGRPSTALAMSRGKSGKKKVVAHRASRAKASKLRLDLNGASFADLLVSFPEMTPASAKAIMEWRDQNGAFAAVEDLERVPGLDPAFVARMRDCVRVGREVASL